MEIQEMYSLCVQVEDSAVKEYSIYQGKHDESKRGHTLMYHETIKGLDDLTSKFSSISPFAKL